MLNYYAREVQLLVQKNKYCKNSIRKVILGTSGQECFMGVDRT